MSVIDEIRQVIEGQLEAIDREVAALRDTLRTLEKEGDAPPARNPRRSSAAAKPASKRRGAATRPRTSKAPVEVVPLGKLEQLLGRSSGGLSAAALAKQANGSPDQIRALLKDLEAAGKVRRTGQRRGTRWRVVTDEDWIAERAAELERRTRSATERKAA